MNIICDFWLVAVSRKSQLRISLCRTQALISPKLSLVGIVLTQELSWVEYAQVDNALSVKK